MSFCTPSFAVITPTFQIERKGIACHYTVYGNLHTQSQVLFVVRTGTERLPPLPPATHQAEPDRPAVPPGAVPAEGGELTKLPSNEKCRAFFVTC